MTQAAWQICPSALYTTTLYTLDSMLQAGSVQLCPACLWQSREATRLQLLLLTVVVMEPQHRPAESVCAKQVRSRTRDGEHCRQNAAWAKNRNASLQKSGGPSRHVTMFGRASFLCMQIGTWTSSRKTVQIHRRRMNLSRTRRASTSPKTVLAQGLFHSHPPLGETRRSPQSCRTPSMVTCSTEKDTQLGQGSAEQTKCSIHKAGNMCAKCPKHEGCPAWWAAAQT